MPADFRDVDPRTLRVSSSRPSGADPGKLQRQLARYGRSAAGMPPIWVYEGTDGELIWPLVATVGKNPRTSFGQRPDNAQTRSRPGR